MGKDLRGKELGVGLSQRKDGRYQARFTTPSNKRIEKNFNRLIDARNWLSEAKYKSKLIKDCDITVDEWYNIWITTYKEGIVADNTTKNYRDRYRYNIKKKIGNIPLNKVRHVQCQQILNDMYDDGKYSYGTMNLVMVTLHAIFEGAVENGYISTNPTDNLKLKKRFTDNEEDTERRVLTREEQKVFTQYSEKSIYHNAFSLVLETGLRVGEIGGLKWSDIDLDMGFLHVKRTLLQNKEKGGFYFGNPKSKTSKRKVPLTESAKAILENQRQLQFKLKKQSRQWDNAWEGLVFTTTNGKPVGYSTFQTTITRMVNNINKDREAEMLGQEYETFEHCYMHSLRHTFATRCIEKGVQPKTLQKILGHSSLKMTMDLYVHVTDEHISCELEKMNMAI